ncbi:MAG: tRNA (adenosine(37)-N6)-threonylcarbamoyltransferase complex transferase subunit TsaD [Thermodesulfobacteriota bacterium]
MLLLGIESSCDETAAAVLRDGEVLLGASVDSQIAVHAPYGGVVPELASRKHLENIQPVVAEALRQAGIGINDLDAIAVTQGPGLIGSLLVGLSFAKATAAVRSIPCVGVDHIAGHLLSPLLGTERPDFPYVALVVSGGHSSIFLVEGPLAMRPLGRTRDDAAGEAFDKVAKLLGLGYPGGPLISRLAAEGDPAAIAFPRAWLEPESLDFSFSGLKTAVACHRQQHGDQTAIADVCASFQEAVVAVLAEKLFRAALGLGIATVALAGGVAANPRLRQVVRERGARDSIRVCLPEPEFCTDNAAMIALAGHFRLAAGETGDPAMDAYSRSQFIKPGLLASKHTYGPAWQAPTGRP